MTPDKRLKWLLWGILASMHGILAWNAAVHDPNVGYDSFDHLKNIAILAQWRLPAAGESYEFFAPPLPYLLPAMAYRAGVSFPAACKLAQFLNVLYSLCLCWGILRLCDYAHPGETEYKILSVSLVRQAKPDRSCNLKGGYPANCSFDR